MSSLSKSSLYGGSATEATKSSFTSGNPSGKPSGHFEIDGDKDVERKLTTDDSSESSVDHSKYIWLHAFYHLLVATIGTGTQHTYHISARDVVLCSSRDGITSTRIIPIIIHSRAQNSPHSVFLPFPTSIPNK